MKALLPRLSRKPTNMSVPRPVRSRLAPAVLGLASSLAILLSLLIVPAVAVAAPEDQGKVEKVVVRNRKHHARGRIELSPGVGFSLTNRLTEHTNLELGIAYNLFETFAIELRPGYALGKLTSVGEQVQTEVYGANPNAVGNGVATNPTPNDFADLWQLQWQGLVLPRWQPIYGKINLATELPIHFQIFLTAGGGVVGLKRESIVYCQNGGAGHPAECAGFLEEERMDVAAAGGGGFRFFVSDMVLLKVELFDIAFLDKYLEAVDRKAAEAEPTGSKPGQGTAAPNPGITNMLFVNVGASVMF